MRKFRYERPETLCRVTQLLASTAVDTRLLAGGTDVVVGLRDGSMRPGLVIDLKRVAEFGGAAIEQSDGGQAGDVLRFSALAVMAQVESDPRVLDQLPALAEAARVVGSVQIRNRATLAGNICNGSPAADTVPPLLVHGATVVIAGPTGERRVSLDDFITASGKVALGHAELLSAIEVPVPPRGTGAAYERLVRRRGTDLASVTMCVAVEATGVTHLAYVSVGPRAFLATEDRGLLADPGAPRQRRNAELEAMLSRATPSPSSMRAAPDYRLAMLRVLAGRALERALVRGSARVT